MSKSTETADVGDQIQELIASRAQGRCEHEDCEQDSGLNVYDISEGNNSEFSVDNLKLLCGSCYSKNYSDKTVTEDDVLTNLEKSNLPFTSTSIISQEFNTTTETARKRLNDLVEAEELERYELDKRRTLYFKPDYHEANKLIKGLRKGIDLTDLNQEAIKAFAKQPYHILPKDDNEYFVSVPNFLDFNIGHLYDKSEAWRTYIVNRYVSWFNDLPDAIEDEITVHKKYKKAKLEGNTLKLADEEERERAWDNFNGQKGPLVQREDDNKIKVQQGKEFDVIADLISGGNLPFTQNPVDPNDIRPAPSSVSLRDYQQDAWETFEEYGSIGVYWPMGLGKTWFGRYCAQRIIGKKLVVVPSSTLEQQWRENIDNEASNPDMWDVRTYQYLTYSEENLSEYQGSNAPKITIFDESHYIPANKFSQLAMIDTKYRIGMSASPYREDDRTEHIFALTGQPVGVDWQKLLEYDVLEYPDVHVYIYNTQRQKKEDLLKLANQKHGNGLIFCDSRDRGEALSDEMGIPFVNGDTPSDERLGIIKDNNTVIASRVADEGMSVDLDWTIEHDFLGSSRRQEIQRTGRVMHNSDNGKEKSGGIHIIQMTNKEYEKHSDRLYSLDEKGFNIELQRRA